MINSSNTEYAVVTDSEVSYIISHFDSNYIYSVVSKSISEKIRPYNMNMPNVVISYEQYFKQVIDVYPSVKDTIWDTRNEVYTQIIKILCDYYQIIFDDSNIQDLYSSAVYLYSFLVSDFQNNIIEFYTNYILKEKNNLYEFLNLDSLKRNKDSSTIYNKKIYKNTRLGIISANLDNVIDNINTFDIDLNTFINIIYNYENKNIAKHLELVITPVNDFFKTYIVSNINSVLRSVLITSIRLKLQKVSTEVELNTTNIIKSEEDIKNE